MKFAVIVAMALFGLSLDARAGDAVLCEGGIAVGFDQPILSLPEGQVRAKFRNLSLLLHDYVTVQRLPVFSMLQIQVESAYCVFLFTIDQANLPYVFRSTVECEGEARKLACEIGKFD